MAFEICDTWWDLMDEDDVFGTAEEAVSAAVQKYKYSDSVCLIVGDDGSCEAVVINGVIYGRLQMDTISSGAPVTKVSP